MFQRRVWGDSHLSGIHHRANVQIQAVVEGAVYCPPGQQPDQRAILDHEYFVTVNLLDRHHHRQLKAPVQQHLEYQQRLDAKPEQKEEMALLLAMGRYGVLYHAQTWLPLVGSFRFPCRYVVLVQLAAAVLAGLAQAPSRDSPIKHFDRARNRQKYVLERMREEGFISDQEFEEALAEPLYIRPEKDEVLEKAAHFIEHIRRIVERKYGRHLL